MQVKKHIEYSIEFAPGHFISMDEMHVRIQAGGPVSWIPRAAVPKVIHALQLILEASNV